MNFLDALADPNLLGGLATFRDLGTWRGWLAFLRAVLGLPLDAAQLEAFRRHTGRATPRAGGYPEAVAVVGRQSGKSQLAAALAVFEAATAARRGEYVVLAAQDLRGAQRALLSYCRECFDVPLFRGEVVRETAGEVELRSGATIAVYPARPASVRGIKARLVVLDELAFYLTSDGRPTDREMLRAVRPTLATTGGRLLVLSSPYGQSGALWDLHRQHYGKDESATLVWQADAASMNPTLPQDYLARMQAEDPEAYRSEVLGEFRAGIASLFDPEALDAVVVPDRRELPPSRELSYAAFVDPSGGRSDAFTVAVGHREGDRAVVDCLRAWRPPFNPSGVVEECAALLGSYGVRSVVGDRYAGEWPREAFRAKGVWYEVAPKDRSQLYLDLLPAVMAGTVELPDVPELLRELRGLERRRGASGRDRVDHGPGAHDDRANAVAGVVSLLAGKDPSDLGISVGKLL